jgi:phage terminase small subunit
MGNSNRTSKLTPRQERFVQEYLIDLNATQAAIRAGYAPKTANREGSRLLSNAVIASAVQKGRAKMAERAQIDQDWVLRQWQAIAEADPRDLVQYLRGPCPDCWDDPHEEPNPGCAKCGGHGKGHVVLTDTRKLSAAAAKLYAGVQLGRDGIKVNMRDQDAALVNIARHLGMFKDSLELKGGINVTISQDDANL